MPNAVGYIRISNLDQSRYSLSSQERMIQEYCDRNKVTLIASFKDDGAHSDTFDRPDYNALETFIRKNKNVQYLVIYDHSRFSRNLAEALMKCAELQKKFKITVLTLNDPIDADFSDPTVFMLRAFQFMQAEAELHNIRKRTKAGMVQAALNGQHANKAPYGYKNERNAKDRPIIVVDEDKAFIIRKLFAEYLAGATLEDLRKMAVRLGFMLKGHSAVRRVLANPVYAGLIKVPPHKGRKSLFAEGIHAPLVSQQDFFLIQDRINNKGIATQNREEVPLRGVLHCWCGRKVTAGNSRSKSGRYYWYYLCQEHRENISAVKLHRQFNDLLDQLSLPEDRVTWLRTKLAEEIGGHLHAHAAKVVEVSAKIKAATRKIETTERKYLLSTTTSEETYAAVITELRGELAGLQRDLAVLNTNQVAYWQRLESLLPKLTSLREAFEKMELAKKQQFINAVFDNRLSIEAGIYRTPSIHPLLAGNELALKEKGLLIIQKPLPKIGITPGRTRDGSGIEHWAALLELIA